MASLMVIQTLILACFWLSGESRSSGQLWPDADKAITLDGRGRGYAEFSAAFVDDKPAVAYLDETSVRGYYVMATSENGTLPWEPQESINGAGEVYMELCGIEGSDEPRFMWTDTNSVGQVKFKLGLGGPERLVHAGSPPTSVFVNRPMALICDCQDGIPCDVFLDTNTVLFERATSSDGTGWNTTVHTVLGINAGTRVKMVQYGIGENLVVIYDADNIPVAGRYGMNVVVSRDPQGMSWNPSVILFENSTTRIKAFDAKVMDGIEEIGLVYEGEGNRLYFRKTMGNATRWTAPVLVATDVDCRTLGITSYREETSDPTLLIVGFTRVIQSKREIWAGYSSDGGTTWGLSRVYNQSVTNRNVAIMTADDHPAVIFSGKNDDLLFLRALADPPPPLPPNTNCLGSACSCDATGCVLESGVIEPGGELTLPADVPTQCNGNLGLRGVRVRFSGPQTLRSSGRILLDSTTKIDFVAVPSPTGRGVQARATVVTTTTVLLEADVIEGQAAPVNVTSEDACTDIISSSDSYSASSLSVLVSTENSCGDSTGLSGGAIAGIVVGVVVGFTVVFFALVYVLREREKARKKARFQASQARLSNLASNGPAQVNVSSGSLIEKSLGIK